MIGTNQKVLFENNEKNGIMQGFTSNYIKFQTNFNSAFAGNIISVKILEANTEFCSGQVSTKKSIDLVTS